MEIQPKHCPRDEILAAYASGELSARQMLQTEEHVANCEECAGLIRKLRRIENTFGQYRLLKRFHAEAISGLDEAPTGVEDSSLDPSGLLAILSGGLMAAAREKREGPEKNRLNNWSRRIANNAGKILEVLSSARGGMETVQRASLDVLREIGWAWIQQVERTPGATTVAVVREAPSGFRARGGPKIQPTPPQGVEIRLEPVPGRNDVEVIVSGLPDGQHRLIVLMLPRNPRLEGRETELARISDNTWIARFDNIDPGEYTLAIEPLANKTDG